MYSFYRSLLRHDTATNQNCKINLKTEYFHSLYSEYSSFALEDMIGNVCEWMVNNRKAYPFTEQDFDENKVFVLRSGSWYNSACNLRSAACGGNSLGHWLRNYGVCFSLGEN
jgi:formylglycine-generating enzyme required for sulfatase activity